MSLCRLAPALVSVTTLTLAAYTYGGAPLGVAIAPCAASRAG